MNFKVIFRPICWIIELYLTFKYSIPISGHDLKELDNGRLKCEICGKVSK